MFMRIVNESHENFKLRRLFKAKRKKSICQLILFSVLISGLLIPHVNSERILQEFGEQGITCVRNLECEDFAWAENDSAELIIGSIPPKSSDNSNLTELIMHMGGIVKTISAGDYLQAYVVRASSRRVLSVLGEIRGKETPFFVEPNQKFKIALTPNDPYQVLQWALKKIGAEYAWNYSLGSSDILIAIVDTGIDYNHPDLTSNYVALGYDWVNDDNDPMDDNGHGTHCAGIIAAAINNNEGIAGLAQVKIMAEKALDNEGYGWTDDVASAIIHAVDNGAKIISCSWGSNSDSVLLHQVIKYAYEKGALIVAAAGNEYSSVKVYPAAYPEVIAVTAVDENDEPAYFTNFGDWVEIAAPGVDILSTYIGNSYARLSGTSMSAPMVAGVAALTWSVFPWMSRDQVRVQLQLTSDDLGAFGFDEYYGYGKINARKAVESSPPESELIVKDWQWPEVARPYETVKLTSNILNFGTQDQANLEFNFFINGTLIQKESILLLLSGHMHKTEFLFTPESTGTYNLTVYLKPANEPNSENNQVTKMLIVRNPEILEVPRKYRTIMEAINNAYVGDTIKVAAGTYYEHISIDKPINIIGEKGKTIIDGLGEGAVIHVFSCSKVNISGLTIRNGEYGLVLHFSSQNKIVDTTIIGNDVYGVELFYSQNNILKNNRIINNPYNFGVIGDSLFDFIQDIDMSNTINDKPIYYLVNEHNKQISSEAGAVVCVNSTNVTVRGLKLENNIQGVLFAYTNNSKIENLILQKHEWAILVVKSFNNIISSNTISDCEYSIDLWISGSNTLSKNQIINSNDGIYAWRSNGNTIINNTISKNTGKGLYMDQSKLNNLTKNIVSQNFEGIVLAWCEKNFLKENIINDNTHNFGVYGQSVENFFMEIDFSNKINGNPIYYLRNQKGVLLKTPECQASYVGLINCTGVKIEGLNLTSNGQGVLMVYTANASLENLRVQYNDEGLVLISSYGITVKNSLVKDNNFGIIMQNCSRVTIINNKFESVLDFGIKVQNSTYNLIRGNIIKDSLGGVSLEFSGGNIVSENNFEDNFIGISIEGLSEPNKIYHNNFIKNTFQAYIWFSINVWDDGYPSGGNYWSDYRCIDRFSGVNQSVAGGDGIADKPYIIDNKNMDRYPLMFEWRKTLSVDVNGDGIVNIWDLWIVAKAYGSKPGDAKWNPNVDFDGNGIINIFDLMTVALQYGKHVEDL
jgi:thermitase